MTKPISPEEVYEYAKSIPPEVFEAFNECILNNFSLETGEAVFTQSEVELKIKKKRHQKPEDRLHLTNAWRERGLLKLISGPYKDAGWKVSDSSPWSAADHACVGTLFTFTRNRAITSK